MRDRAAAPIDALVARFFAVFDNRNGRPAGVLRSPGRRSPPAYVQVAREAFGGFNAMMAHLSDTERGSTWNEVTDAMRRFESADGFEAPGECLYFASIVGRMND